VLEIVQQKLVLIENRNADRTALQDAHQPDLLKTKLCDGVPFGRWNRAQADSAPELRADGGEPDPCV
jgi:hypothetical protein